MSIPDSFFCAAHPPPPCLIVCRALPGLGLGFHVPERVPFPGPGLHEVHGCCLPGRRPGGHHVESGAKVCFVFVFVFVSTSPLLRQPDKASEKKGRTTRLRTYAA